MASTATAQNEAAARFVDAAVDTAKEIVNEMYGRFTRKSVRANAEANALRLVLADRLATMSPAATKLVLDEVERRAA